MGDVWTWDTQTLGISEHGGGIAAMDIRDMQDRQTEDKWARDTWTRRTGDHEGHTEMKGMQTWGQVCTEISWTQDTGRRGAYEGQIDTREGADTWA